PTIRLGKVSQRTAEGVKYRVEQLLAAKLTGQAIDADATRWLGQCEPAFIDKLARVGLVAKPNAGLKKSVETFFAEWLARRHDYKPASRRAWRQVTDALTRM